MHRPVCITYDSTCDLTPQLLERFRIRTVPLTIQSGERVFPDDGRYTSADLYADYRSRGTLPKTAAVSPEEFKSFFAPILAEGYDIVHIDISAELSCTCQNAVLAAQELTERGEIHVVDSRQLSTGGGLLALRGAKLRDAGMAAADIAAELRRLAPHSDTSFVLDTLEYMWKGTGRQHAEAEALSGDAGGQAGGVQKVPRLHGQGVSPVHRGAAGGEGGGSRPRLHHPFRRGAGGDAVAADGAGAGAGSLRGGIRHSGGLHGFLPLRPGHAGRAVPAEGVTKPEIGSRRRRLMPAPFGFASWEKKERKLSTDPATPL